MTHFFEQTVINDNFVDINKKLKFNHISLEIKANISTLQYIFIKISKYDVKVNL